MKVTLISTYDANGGAGIACYRLYQALSENSGHTINLLTDRQYGNGEDIHSISARGIPKFNAFLRFSLERFYFLNHARSKKVLYQFSPANVGKDISKHPLVQQADVLHLHWVHFGFLSISSLQKLIKLNKPIVWTLHDMWAFTGGCHYSGSCQNFEQSCGNCPFLKSPHAQDLSFTVHQRKKALLKKANITFVTCSHWLEKEARKSSLLTEANLMTIHNPIDLEYFKPDDKEQARKRLGLAAHKFYLSFGAANVQDERKGLSYLQEALQIFSTMVDNTDDIELLIFGKAKPEFFEKLPFKAHIFGNLSGQSNVLPDIYNAASVFVLPSLQDNFPNTILEAMACGTPCLAFDTGGIPEMIDHQNNGYLAQYKNNQSLAEGLHYLYKNTDAQSLANKARNKATQCSYQKIARAYSDVYMTLL